MKRLYRSETDRVIAGVCGGIAEYQHLDPSLVRLLTAAFVLTTFPMGLLVYIAAVLVVPSESELKEESKPE